MGGKQPEGKLGTAKASFFKNRGFLFGYGKRGKLRDEFPAVRSLNAVGHRKILSFLGFGIVCSVCVLGKQDGTGEGAYFFDNGRDNGCGLGTAQRTGYKILLHIDYD